MSVITLKAGKVEPVEVYARAAAGGALTGSTNLRVQVRRQSNGHFFDFNDSTFKASGWTTKQATLTEVSSTDEPGWYSLSGGLDTSGWADGSYLVTTLEVSTTLVANGPQFATGEIRVGGSIENLDSRLPAALVSGRMDASAGAVAAGVITSTEAPALANLDAAVSTRLAAASYTAPPSAADVADAVLDEALSGHVTSGTAGEAIGRLDVAISTRAAPGAAMDLVDNAVDAGAVAASGVSSIQTGLATASALGIVGTAVTDVQSRLPSALVGGRMDASVGAVAADTITASAIAADAIGASQLAASAVTEIQTGLATSSSLSSVATSASNAATSAADIQTRLPASLIAGRMDSSVGAMQADTVTSSAVAASAVSEIQTGLATSAGVSAVGVIAASVAAAVDAMGLDVDDLQTRLPAALVGGRMDSHVGAMGSDTITSGAVASSAVTELQSGVATSVAVAAVDTKVADVQERIPAALVSGRLDAHVGAMGANTLTASALAADAVTEITSGVGAAIWATAEDGPAEGTYGFYVKRAFQLGFNRLELDSVGGGRNVLYDDDASTILATFTLRDVAGGSITLTTGAPARRGPGVAP